MAQAYDECHIFIREVRHRPCLWDRNDQDYNNREKCETAIEDLSKKFGVPG